MIPASVSTEHIAITPGTCGGRPRIAGTRIRVQDVALWHEEKGMTPEAIVDEYPHLTLADVHAALAYYHDHRDEIHAALRRDDELYETLRASQPSIWDKARACHARSIPQDQLPSGRELSPDDGPGSPHPGD